MMFLLSAVLSIGCIDMIMHDWAHIYVVSGLFQVEMQYILIFLNSLSRRALFAAPIAPNPGLGYRMRAIFVDGRRRRGGWDVAVARFQVTHPKEDRVRHPNIV